ncbi:MAG: hypothetical protein HY507_01060, partial [Candidatus Zambryskibacteria bacterium]|nr:hypothetical protein [Candidatus Zambryskibacteria bacterium]
MNILTVIPIARGISKDTLSYFTKKDVPVGSIVSIPLRKKRAYGLVVESKTASEAKSEIKTLPYSIKKVGGVESRSFLSPAFIKSAEKIADYNAASTGAVLSVLIPKPILEESVKFSHITKESPRSSFYETVLLQTDDEERYATYRSLIREEFAKNRSIFCCLPTTEELLNAKEILEKGIEKYTYILHSGLSKKEILSAWQKIISEKHPVLIIATGYFIGIPRNDLGVIILEKESSRAYKTLSRPFLDIRDVAKTIAKQLNIRLVLGDLFLRVETLWKGKSLTYSELSPLKFRSLSTAVLEVIDVHSPANMKKKEFSVLGDALKKMLQQARANNEQTFLFCGRKGLYPETICSDCGTPVTCKNCNAPVVLYGKTSKRLFVCHHCGERRDADELCRNCGGWRLLSLGIGIEKVLEEIKSVLDNTKIFIMDKDHIKNHKQAVKMRDSFYNTPGAICLGTEMALPYLKDKIENTAVVSLDSYFSIPDFRINEKIFHILLSLRALAEKRMVVQTRREDRRIFDYALHGNLIDFYRDEIEERKLVGYPPFATHVKITLEGEKNKMKK